MSVRAQFRCTSVAALDPGEHNRPMSKVVLQAVYGRGVENAAWSRATPNGHLDMTITNPDAIGTFVPGQAYWLDISPVEDTTAAKDFSDPVNEAKATGMRTSLGLNTLTTQDGTTIAAAAA